MTDPNFIRWLYNSADEAGGPRYVIFVRQASPVGDPRVRKILEESAAARWARYGVTPVWANYYGEDPPVDLSRHHLGLGLWAVDHEQGQVINWASADRAYQELGAASANPLHAHSRWVAATAIANGVSVEQDPMVYASRWRFVRAVPIVVEPDGERSVVGAITLTSTTPLGEFPLAQAAAPSGLLNEIDAFLAKRAGSFFVDP